MEQLIRKIINSNNQLIYDKYFKTKPEQWIKLCSALDVLEDTDLAIESYLTKGIGNSDGEKYLRLYGLLQAVYLQQDAITALKEVVSILVPSKKMQKHETQYWEKLRSYRNLCIGHPVECKSYEKEEINRAFISRVTISDRGFQLLRNRDKKNDTCIEDVDIKQLIFAYREEAKNMLNDLARIHSPTYAEVCG